MNLHQQQQQQQQQQRQTSSTSMPGANPSNANQQAPRPATGTTLPSAGFTTGGFPPFNLPNFFDTRPPTAQPTSSAQTRPGPNPRGPGVQLPGFPFNLDNLNPSSVLGHPDPLVPCQSFHFGPRFQQADDRHANRRPHLVAEVNSVVIEHIQNLPTSNQNQGSQNPTQGISFNFNSVHYFCRLLKYICQYYVRSFLYD